MIVLMYNIYGVMNITGYKKPTDEEFKKCYKTLFDLCPRPREYGTDEYKAKVEQAWEKFFDEQKKNLSVDTLPGERWEQHPTLKTYMCSTCGRVKIKINGTYEIQEQIDWPGKEKKGYLILKKFKTPCLVYRLIADVFCERQEGEGRAVHHINNNGYDNIADNLIMLTETQHNLIHCDEMGEI